MGTLVDEIETCQKVGEAHGDSPRRRARPELHRGFEAGREEVVVARQTLTSGSGVRHVLGDWREER